MSRIILTYIVPFLLPEVIYIAWLWYRTRYVARHGGEAPRLEQGPWFQLAFAGAVLAFGVLGATALIRGDTPDSLYVPPHLDAGKMVPGHVEPKIGAPIKQ